MEEVDRRTEEGASLSEEWNNGREKKDNQETLLRKSYVDDKDRDEKNQAGGKWPWLPYKQWYRTEEND